MKVNKLGEVVECYASDEEFQYENVSVNDEPIRITDVVEVEDLSQIEDSQKIVILKEEVKKNIATDWYIRGNECIEKGIVHEWVENIDILL